MSNDLLDQFMEQWRQMERNRLPVQLAHVDVGKLGKTAPILRSAMARSGAPYLYAKMWSIRDRDGKGPVCAPLSWVYHCLQGWHDALG